MIKEQENKWNYSMYNTYFTVLISAFPIFCFSLCFLLPVLLSLLLPPSLPTPASLSSSPPPSVRTNCSQKPQHSKHSTQPRTLSLSLSLSQSASMSLVRTYAQESTCLSPSLSLSLSQCYTQESACLSLFLSPWLRGE